MLYLTTYHSAHLREIKYHDDYSIYDIFYNPDKSRTIWYLENDAAILKAEKEGMTSLIATRQEVSTLEKALEIIGPQSPLAFKYLNDAFNDDEAKQLAQFIRSATRLIYLGFQYSSNGNSAYRQSGNTLTDVGYDIITQAIEVNPLIQNMLC